MVTALALWLRREWLRFNNRDFSLDSRKEFKKRLMEIKRKEIERPETLDIEEFPALHEGIALQNLNQFRHVSFRQGDRTFTSQVWNRLFRIQEQVVKEYVMKFLSSFTFRDNIIDLDNVDTMVFQLGGENRSMMMRQLIVALGRHSGKEKVTLDDLFLLHSIDGGIVVWTNDSGGIEGVTLGPETSLISVAKLVELGICKYYALGYGEIVDDVLEVAGDEGAGAAMDERLGDIETDISKLVGNIDELTYVVSGMSEQYNQFYREFGLWRTEQERFQTWNTDHLSQLLAHHHIDHTRYNGTPYAYVPDIPDLRVQQGVNFMSSTPIYSIAPSFSPSLFSLFGDDNAGPSTYQNQQDDMNED
ncbi:hypothetical protein Tco_0243429 [Tanacetum coccineum]